MLSELRSLRTRYEILQSLLADYAIAGHLSNRGSLDGWVLEQVERALNDLRTCSLEDARVMIEIGQRYEADYLTQR